MRQARLHAMAGLGLLALLLMAFAPSAPAAIDAYSFPDEESRERYNRLVDELRCPQCLNTNLAGSDSMIAKDLRREIHRQRYGDFILYRPQLKRSTLLLWFGPLLLLLVGLLFFWRMLANRSKAEASALSAVEEDRLQRLLDANPTQEEK